MARTKRQKTIDHKELLAHYAMSFFAADCMKEGGAEDVGEPICFCFKVKGRWVPQSNYYPSDVLYDWKWLPIDKDGNEVELPMNCNNADADAWAGISIWGYYSCKLAEQGKMTKRTYMFDNVKHKVMEMVEQKNKEE